MECRDLARALLRFFPHVFVAKKQKAASALPRGEPAEHVIAPATDLGFEFRFDETRHELFQAAVFGNHISLQLKFIVGDSNVARVAHDVEDLPVARIKTLMALDDPWSRKRSQHSVGDVIDFGDARLKGRERDGMVRIEQVADQKPSPRIPGPRERDKKCVCRRPRAVSSGPPGSPIAPFASHSLMRSHKRLT